MICCDPKCQKISKLLKGEQEQLDHLNHQIIQISLVKGEIAKINHPIRSIMQPFEYEAIIEKIIKRADEIKKIFETNLQEMLNRMKKEIGNIYKETQIMKRVYDIVEGLKEESLPNQDDLLQIPKLIDQNQILELACQTIAVQVEPLKKLNDLENMVKSLFLGLNSEELKKVEEGINNNNQVAHIQQKIFENKRTKNEAEIIKQMVDEKDLTVVNIDLIGQMINRNDLKQPNEIFKAISKFKDTLTELTLALSSTSISDVSELSKALRELKWLEKLCLPLGNTKIVRVHDLGKALGCLKQLQILELILWSTNVSDISEIGKGIGQIKTLEELEIQLGNTYVYDVTDLGKGIGENMNLKDLSLNLEFTKVQDIRSIAQGIQKLKFLREFELDLIDTKVPIKIRKNFYLVSHFLSDYKSIYRNNLK